MLIATGKLPLDSLSGTVALVTGAGRGIGFEAARSLAALGAHVIIAEIDDATAEKAAAAISEELGAGSAAYVNTDVGSEESVAHLKLRAHELFDKVDVVLNNATITPMGAIKDRPINDWDTSYRVNLRGPVLLAQAFLPGMIARDAGVFVCVSSVGQAYMGAYECFKAAQVHLAETLDAELDGTKVYAFAIGPGLVRTPGAVAGITELAPMYGKTVDEFFDMSKEHIITPEQAGAGFAAAIVLASQFRGQEISSTQALIAAGIPIAGRAEAGEAGSLAPAQKANALTLCRSIRATLAEQSAGWAKRSLFERQWVIRDFRKTAGMPADQWLASLDGLAKAIEEGGRSTGQSAPPLDKLADYYDHLAKLAAGYEKNPEKLKEQLAVVKRWEQEVRELATLIRT